MGRLIILLLVVVTVIVLWKGFGPGSGNRALSGGDRRPLGRRSPAPAVERKGPDDDPDFLWQLKKERFKEQREKERAAE